MLCCAVLCCAVLCCAVLCCAVLCSAVPCRIIMHHVPCILDHTSYDLESWSMKQAKAEQKQVGQDQECVPAICSRFVAQLPEHGPKHECNADCKGESGGIVGRGAPEGDEELADDDEVLLPEVAGVLGVKVQGGHLWVRCTDLSYQPLLPPADANHLHCKAQAQVGQGARGRAGGESGGGRGGKGGEGGVERLGAGRGEGRPAAGERKGGGQG